MLTTVQDESKLRGKSYKILDTIKGATRFTTPTLQKLVGKSNDLDQQYSTLSSEILLKVKEITGLSVIFILTHAPRNFLAFNGSNKQSFCRCGCIFEVFDVV